MGTNGDLKQQARSRVHHFIECCEESTAPDLDVFLEETDAELRDEVERRCRAYLKLGVLLSIDETAPPPDTTAMPGPIGDFRPIRLLGRGGMGAVYLAEQVSLGREVALKVLTPRPGGAADRGERFRREALAVARLRHPNIVRVLTYGEEDQFFYFAMEYVEGKSLADVIASLRDESAEGRSKILHSIGSGSHGSTAAGPHAGGRLPTARSGVVVAAGIGLRVAEALAYAHEQGIVHRDVKPSNILMQEDGVPLLADFGLAKEQDSVKLSLSGDVIGTPQYMSPEQTHQDTVDERTDVYSLGVTLYELLAGHLPFDGTTLHEVFQQVQHREPVPLRKLGRPDLPIDLETIVLTAMEKNPDRRYACAADMAEDLRRFLDLRPILARPVGRIEHAVRWARRHPTQVLGIGLFLLLLIAAPVVFVLQKRAEQEEARAERATEQRDGLRLLAEASTAMDASPGLALLLAIEGAELAPGLHANNTLYAAWAKNSGPGAEARSLLGHGSHIRCVVYTPDGKTLVSGSHDGTARVWDTSTGEERFRIEHGGEVVDVQTSADGESVITASTDGSARICSIEDEKETHVLRGHEGPVFLAGLISDTHAVTASLDGTLRRWNLADGSSTVFSRKLQPHGYDRYVVIWGRVEHTVAITPSGSVVAAICVDDRVRAWRPETGKLLFTSPRQEGAQSIVVSDDGRHVGLRRSDSALVWSIATGSEFKFEEPGTVGNVCFSPDGTEIATSSSGAGARAVVTIYDIASRQKKRILPGLSAGPKLDSLRFSHDGQRIASAITAGEVLVWDTDSSADPVRIRGHELLVLDHAFSPTGDYLATAAEDRSVRIWEIGAAARSFLVAQHDGAVTSLGYGDRSHVVTGSGDRTCKILDRRTGETVDTVAADRRVRSAQFVDDFLLVAFNSGARVFALDETGVVSKEPVREILAAPWSIATASLSPDAAHLVFAARRGLEGRATVHEVRTGKLLFQLHGHQKAVRSANYSRDGSQIVTTSFDGTARVWDARNGTNLHVLNENSDVRWAEFSPDGRLLVTGVWEKTASIWSLATGERVVTLTGHLHAVECASFSADGALVVTASLDGTARLWDVATGDCIATLRHPQAASVARMSPDQDEVIVGCADGAVYRWPYPPLPAARARKSRELTVEERRRFEAQEPASADATTAPAVADVVSHLHDAWSIVRLPGADRARYEAALAHIEEARRLAERPQLAADLVGAAKLRLGDARAARTLLEEALEAHRKRVLDDDLMILSFLILACRELDADAAVQHYGRRARPLTDDDRYRWDVLDLYEEATQ